LISATNARFLPRHRLTGEPSGGCLPIPSLMTFSSDYGPADRAPGRRARELSPLDLLRPECRPALLESG
jgi:hypothetical protein